MPEKVSDIKRQKSIARSSGWSCAQMPRATYCHRDRAPGQGAVMQPMALRSAQPEVDTPRIPLRKEVGEGAGTNPRPSL